MASIKDVAKKAGVGVATVSRVLNENGYVSEQAKEKVQEAMKELNYTPNEVARQLYRKKVGIVAVLIPDVSQSFYGELTKNIETILFEHGYKTMICDTFKEKNSEQEYLSMLDRHVVDGIITGVHSLKVESYLKIKKPIVAFDRYLGKKIPVVEANHTDGGKRAAEILINCGCKKVLQFQGARIVKSPSHERHVEFERILRENGVEVILEELEWNSHDHEYFEKTTRMAMEKYADVDGVFGTDMLAAYAMKAAIKQGRQVPKDVKIVAYDGTFITEVTTPSMTTIVQPIQLIAQNLVEIICKMIEGETFENYSVKLDIDVREGESTKVNI